MAIRVLAFKRANTKGKPNEDALLALRDRGRFAVADGVTRFLPEGHQYPDPSPASGVAAIFCGYAVRCMQGVRPETEIRKAFRDANVWIRRFNDENGITKETTDYLEKDFACCVGILGVLAGNRLHYGYIGDCGLMVFNQSLKPIHLTPNNLAPLERFKEGCGFSSKKERTLWWRRDMRNKPDTRHLTYGVLTGEPEALHYLETGSVRLLPGDTAILFSDGILPFVFESSFREAAAKAVLLSESVGELALSEIDKYIGDALSRLAGRAANLDDDKSFIAIQLA